LQDDARCYCIIIKFPGKPLPNQIMSEENFKVVSGPHGQIFDQILVETDCDDLTDGESMRNSGEDLQGTDPGFHRGLR